MLDAEVDSADHASLLRHDVVRGLGAWAVLVGVIGAGGVLARTRFGWWYRFDLDLEYAFAAVISAVALALAGLTSVRASLRGVAGAALTTVGVLLVAMAADELVGAHEWFEARSGVDWQLLYLPVAMVAGLAFGAVAYRCRAERWFLVPWLAGAALWVLAQGLELVQWDGDVQRAHYTKMMLVEEVAELAGTGCFLVATWAIARRRSGATSGG